ncbi:hypothetical protein [Bacillus mesophilum]|uniref:Uncharacterized protein n=1 Tax=Bacillus mesophilum TaxID=1071718 RepID=A0A7V7RNC5_9BACI|nr:hypothetical protein [Bacillus mesophilum]KAB2333965.1 hypothetical protein F7732_07735 [Bacillus mesophilum]
MIKLIPFQGTVTMITDLMGQNGEGAGCSKLMTVENSMGSIVNFVVTPATYFAEHEAVAAGDMVTGYYDGNAPAILIYPPQYPAIVMVKEKPYQNVKADYFNTQLISSNGELQLIISPYTQILLTNGQPFSGSIANRNLIVFYGTATNSVPAQTNPYKIIVLCQ